MLVKEYIQHLNKLPQDLEVYYAGDSEGNTYEKVFYAPSVQDRKELEIEGEGKVVVIN